MERMFLCLIHILISSGMNLLRPEGYNHFLSFDRIYSEYNYEY